MEKNPLKVKMIQGCEIGNSTIPVSALGVAEKLAVALPSKVVNSHLSGFVTSPPAAR